MGVFEQTVNIRRVLRKLMRDKCALFFPNRPLPLVARGTTSKDVENVCLFGFGMSICKGGSTTLFVSVSLMMSRYLGVTMGDVQRFSSDHQCLRIQFFENFSEYVKFMSMFKRKQWKDGSRLQCVIVWLVIYM